LTILTFFGLRIFLAKNSLAKNHMYTIGRVFDKRAEKGGAAIDYRFMVKSKEYTSVTWPSFDLMPDVGDRFYVIFSPSNPQNCEMLLQECVPPYIKEAPPEGWKKIPR
jgi:hypothetical protein